MTDNVLSALASIPVSSLSYTEWVSVGFALKNDGYPCSVWEDWSRNDSRYHEGECIRKWETFSGSDDPVTSATIIQMAKDRGWKGYDGNPVMDWNDSIEFDGDAQTYSYNGCDDFRTYLKTLFKPEEYVSYVVSSYKSKDGKYVPSSAGCADRTAGELLKLIDKYPDDLGAVIGDWNREAGAWIRFNPVDGKGAKNENITSFRYALVESDSMPLEQQNRLYRELNLPIAVLVSSGGKSLHAIVHIDASDRQQYRERVDYLYGYLKEKGVDVDTQNRNPSRLSRLPGVTRGDKIQRIEAVNTGASSWDRWIESIESSSDDLPQTVSLADFRDNPPVLPDELLQGILRCGHKMIISGPSKAGKSFLLMELCVCLAEGLSWLGFKARQGKVLYVNLEIDPSSCIVRFLKIYRALKISNPSMENITIWNLRGNAIPLDKLAPKLIKKIQGKGYEAVVLDPIYKLSMGGDENSASDMGIFCNQFDRICSETGCSAIYCHHHSKGSQGSKRAIDRSSGSGVFARDPDAVLDIIELEQSNDVKNNIRDGHATAWRMEASLREFASPKPVNFWFEFPIHRIDNENLGSLYTEGSPKANLAKSSKRTKKEDRYAELVEAFSFCEDNGAAGIKEMAEHAGLDCRTINRHVKEFGDEFYIRKGLVFRKKEMSGNRTDKGEKAYV